MPIIPTVFRPIRANDVQTRPVKAYKRYTVTSGSFSGSGYRVHTGIHDIYTDAVSDSSYNYPTNADGVNQHVAWRWIDHRYYRYPYDPARSHELTDKRRVEKFLFVSSSTLTVPYFEMGESIKPGSFTVSSSVKNVSIRLEDDGYGNLRDPQIATSSFATSSRCFFYMGFDNEFRKFDENFSSPFVYEGIGYIESGSIEYIFNGKTLQAEARSVTIQPVINVSGIPASINSPYFGLGASFDTVYSNTPSGIRVPHHETFNRFNPCDRWTISFWGLFNYNNSYLVKGPLRKEQYFDITRQQTLERDVVENWPTVTAIANDTSVLTGKRFPFMFVHAPTDELIFLCGNGSKLTELRYPVFEDALTHVAVTRDNTAIRLYIDGIEVVSDTMISGDTSNNADIEIGCYGGYQQMQNMGVNQLDEIRFYDYAASATEIASLANRHYISGSLHQTNVAGNIFYRNGQAVISSVHPKYNSGSGFFNTPFTALYRGTHTLYENEVLIRVPADQFNYTMNPTATYRPGTDGSNNDCNATTAGAESNNGPGELYLSPFVSGTVGPYITTIGLYNDNAQLLAVGKLGTAITKRSDVDMNFIIRWDY
jgi:hypothetical protein